MDRLVYYWGSIGHTLRNPTFSKTGPNLESTGQEEERKAEEFLGHHLIADIEEVVRS